MTALALSGQTSRTRVCPLLDQSGQRWILAGDGLSAYDPKRTLAVHCGNGFDAGFRPLLKYSPEPIGCRLLSLGSDMKRREFFTLIGGATVWPLAARAQQSAMPVVGFLSSGAPGPFAEVTDAFRQSLSEGGYVAGKNVTIEFRWVEGQYDRLPALAADLIQHGAAVIVAAGGAVTARAAKAATSTIPIVFIIGDDPVKTGLVASLNRPGGNVTGVNLFIGELVTKRLDLLTEMVPNATTIAVLVNPDNPNAETDAKEAQTAAYARGRQIVLLNASNVAEIDAAFATIAQRGVGALLIGTDIFFTSRRDQLVALASRHGIPVMHQWREFVVEGGLMSYGTTHTEPYRQAGSYTARILKGEKPADLPVIQPTKFELVINLKTAKALGLTVPPSLLTRADDVIE
jgi:putative tryptophan/tyrosine transport system substrate-binding protein